jgi:four helix bundle protein
VGAIKSYRDLEVWKQAMDLVEQCYRRSEQFPRHEEFGLRAQLRRSSISVPSNIAEGHGRSTTGDFVRHLSIAHGSLMELETQILIAGRLDYLDTADVDDLLKRTDGIGRMLTSLGRRLRERNAARQAPAEAQVKPSSLVPRSSSLT